MKRYEAPLTGTDIMNGYYLYDAPQYANLSRIGIMMTVTAILIAA